MQQPRSSLSETEYQMSSIECHDSQLMLMEVAKATMPQIIDVPNTTPVIMTHAHAHRRASLPANSKLFLCRIWECKRNHGGGLFGRSKNEVLGCTDGDFMTIRSACHTKTFHYAKIFRSIAAMPFIRRVEIFIDGSGWQRAQRWHTRWRCAS